METFQTLLLTTFYLPQLNHSWTTIHTYLITLIYLNKQHTIEQQQYIYHSTIPYTTHLHMNLKQPWSLLLHSTPIHLNRLISNLYSSIHSHTDNNRTNTINTLQTNTITHTRIHIWNSFQSNYIQPITLHETQSNHIHNLNLQTRSIHALIAISFASIPIQRNTIKSNRNTIKLPSTLLFAWLHFAHTLHLNNHTSSDYTATTEHSHSTIHTNLWNTTERLITLHTLHTSFCSYIHPFNHCTLHLWEHSLQHNRKKPTPIKA